MKKLIATLLAGAAVFTAVPPVEAYTTPWLTCSYDRGQQIVKKCRLIELTDNAYRIEWIDGKADVFYYTGNGRYVDTRGGVWTGKSQEYQGNLFLSLRSVSSGMVIIVML